MKFDHFQVSTVLQSALIPAVTKMNDSISNASLLFKLKFLVLTIAIASIPSIITLSQKHMNITSWFYKFLWVVPFIINVITVSMPGRFDGSQIIDENGKVNFPWRTLFEPSGWAFAIWGVIYLSELLITAYVATIGKPILVLQKTVPYWLAGNLLQSIWCFCFRPEFKQYLWLPMSCLGLGAISFGISHNQLTQGLNNLNVVGFNYDKIVLLLLRFPFSLHTGWLAAATLLNLNGWVSVTQQPMKIQIIVAFLSSYLGAIIGGILSYYTKDPFIGFTVAWALIALSTRTKGKLTELPLLTDKDTLMSLSTTQKFLSYILCTLGILMNINLPKPIF